MSAVQSTCSGWCSKWRGVFNVSWIFTIWAITATWSLPDVHVECVYSVHVVQCCFETPPTWDSIKLLYYDSPSPPHRTHHAYIHTCTTHPPTARARLLPQANHTHQLTNIKTTQSETDQTGNGFILHHVALSFVWRDPAVFSDGMWVNPDICKQQRPTLYPLLHLWLFHVVYNQTF